LLATETEAIIQLYIFF